MQRRAVVGSDSDATALAAAQAEGEPLGMEIQRFLEDAVTVLPCSFDQVVKKIPDFTRPEWDALAALIGLTPASRHYERRGAWAYLAAWDVHRAKVFG